jgi:outer membrane protein assembly factor BamB
MAATVRAAMATVLAACAMAQAGGDPVGWRNDGTGKFAGARPPLEWSQASNVLWKTAVPQRSNASPVLVGDLLFICAEPSVLMCLAAKDGAVLWQRPNSPADIAPPDQAAAILEKEKAAAALRGRVGALEKQLKQAEKKQKENPADAQASEAVKKQQADLDAARAELSPLADFLPPSTHDVNGYSTPTPASDGERVYALFGTGIAACYDLKGNRLWARLIERPTAGWGHSASPVLAGNRLVVHINAVFALDKDTGAEVWKHKATAKFGSPVRARLGNEDVVVTAGGDVLRVADGTVLARNVCGLEYCAPIVQDGVAYFVQHGGKAVRLPADASTNAAAAALWETQPPKERYYASPVCHDGILYAITQKQELSALDAATGTVLYSHKLPMGGTVYPSVTLAGSLLCVSSDDGTMLMVEPGRDGRVVATNRLEAFRSSPLFDGNRFFVRGLQNLYCIAAGGAAR